MRLTIWVVFTLGVCACTAGDSDTGALPEASVTSTNRSARSDPALQRVEPFSIFDNVYYIGIGWVSAYLVDTGDGLIMIDALYDDFVDTAIEDIKGLGFDPEDPEYILVTHGHFDHVGGAGELQHQFGAQVVMTEADWELTEASLGPSEQALVWDMVATDGDEIVVGNTTVHFYVTPGHTPGVLSLELAVRDGETEHRAFTFGGVGLNLEGVERTEVYLRSVRRIQELAQAKPIEVNLANHPGMGRLFERRDLLAERAPGEPHPFVDATGYLSWLDELRENGEVKLGDERAEVGR
jgi:metallo-beta-lactamase class B